MKIFWEELSMKNKSKKNTFRANIFLIILAAGILITTVTETTTAKSMYIIADINADPTPIRAYSIGAGGTLSFQAEYGIPNYGIGAVGLAIDTDSKSLFVTYERSNIIQLINATTMTDIGTTTAPGAKNLAGIVYDHDKELLYCVDRGLPRLYVYKWEASTATLTQVSGSPFTLTGTTTAYGIALDEIKDLLYVADSSPTINVYCTSDWSSWETITVSRTVISIAVDAKRGFLYCGGGFAEDNYYLTQFNLKTYMETEVQVGPDFGVMGIGVDPDTGLIYLGTGINNKPGGDSLRVYDTSLNQIDIITDIRNSTGLVVPIEDISYNPLNLYKSVASDAADEVEHVRVGGTITYNIYFDNNNNDYTVNNISIVDTLPKEVSFITADDDGVFGQYDPIAHVYRWSYSSLPPRSPGDCLTLVVQVNEGTDPDKTITNYVTIKSDEAGQSTASVDFITKPILYNPLNLSKNIIGGNIEYNADSTVGYVGVGNNIIYSICFDNSNNDYSVNNISIVDTLPKEVSFITADGDGVFGQYDPIAHTYKWSYPSLPPGSPGDCLTLVVQVNEGTAPDKTITNFVAIDSDETEPVTASVDVVTHERPLEAALSVLPNMLRRNGCYESILAIVELPQGIGKQDIKDEPLILYPGNIKASSQLILGTADKAEVRAWFDTAQLMDAVPGYGEVTVIVVGKLKSGQSFSGEEIIYITRFSGN